MAKLWTWLRGDPRTPGLEALEASRAELAQRVQEQTEDLRALNTRFETAIGGSAITVTEQDENLRYTWVYNPPQGLMASQIIGYDEFKVMDAGAAARLQAVKREVLDTGEPRRGEVKAIISGRDTWLAYTVTPTRLRNGRKGIVVSSTDITAVKAQQAHLEVVMQELNHRSKNLLTIVQSIARQTALGLDVPEDFNRRLADRLKSLAAAHDVLIEQEWRAANLQSVVESQLQHHVKERVHASGDQIELPPEFAHYVGLALHELGANAVKYGALSTGRGRVDVSWRLDGGEDGGSRLTLLWREMDGPPVMPSERRGFGRNMLESLVPRAMGGRAELDFAPAGLSWRLEAPISARG